jgi:hypothetical protein
MDSSAVVYETSAPNVTRSLALNWPPRETTV